MNRFEMTRRVLLLEAAAAELKARAARVRADLNADARAELAEQGTRPTWRTDMGTWSLPVSEEAPTVNDAAELARWVKRRYPTEILEVVNPAFQTALLARLQPVGEVVMDRTTGEVVPGLGVRPGGVPMTLRFRPDVTAQAVAADAARQLVDDVAAGLGIEEGSDA